MSDRRPPRADDPATGGQRTTGGTDRRPPRERDESTPNTTLNALIGGVVTAATAFILPFSPVLGGGVAGYLEGGETRDGVWVGVLAGVVALVPLVALLLLGAFFVLGALFVPVTGPHGGLGPLFVGGLLLFFASIYVVGFSAVGGVLGAYLKREL